MCGDGGWSYFGKSVRCREASGLSGSARAVSAAQKSADGMPVGVRVPAMFDHLIQRAPADGVAEAAGRKGRKLLGREPQAPARTLSPSGGELQEGDHDTCDQQLGEDDLDDRLVDDCLDVRFRRDLGGCPADGGDDRFGEFRVRPGRPRIRFLSIRSRLCSTLPSNPASQRRPCASLILRRHQVG